MHQIYGENMRICELTNRKKMFGNKVSHSNVKTRRTYMLNLHNVTLFSVLLNKKFRMKISSKALRTVDFKHGLDGFLLGTKSAKLSSKALRIKKLLLKMVASSANNQQSAISSAQV